MLGSSRATAAPRGREPPGHPLAPSPWEQGQPVLPPQHRPLLLGWPGAGLGEERGALAEPSLGRSRLARGSQPGARSGQQELSRFLRPRAEKARPQQVPKLRPAAQPGMGSEGGGSRTGLGPAAARGHWSCLGSRSPPCHPSGTQATAVTTISFYSLHLYIHGIKPPVPAACSRHRLAPLAHQNSLAPAASRCSSHRGQTHTSISIPGAGWEHPCDPQAGWRVKHLGWIHPSIHPRDGERAPATALGGSWSAESPQETPAAGAAHSPRPPLSSRAKLFLTGNLPSVKTKRE